MDFSNVKRFRRLILACLVASSTGCVVPQTPVTTVWQKLGIPQNTARLRDGLINRRGNFPGLEKKPPLLKIADPANLQPEKPDMLKAAAKIKQEQDLKKQKLKALKYLAEINCGCYNKDGAVEAAFLEALSDCDPDIRTAAIEGLEKAAGNCKCKTGCETTCCTKKLLDKLQDIATGVDDKGCFKEPVPEIRKAAKAVFCKCPQPAPEPIVPEELIAPEADPIRSNEVVPLPQEGKIDTPLEGKASESVEAKEVNFKLRDSGYGQFDARPVVYEANRGKPVTKKSDNSVRMSDSETASPASSIRNPEQLVTSKVVEYRRSLGELLIQMPDAFEMEAGWNAIVVDNKGNHSLATITDVGGRRILLTVERPDQVQISTGTQVRLGLVAK
jgi:hypothetical protein